MRQKYADLANLTIDDEKIYMVTETNLEQKAMLCTQSNEYLNLYRPKKYKIIILLGKCNL